jgi:hypothetical protein
MRQLVLATCFAALLLVRPTTIQTAPAGPAEAAPIAPDERVVMDAVFWAMPGPVNDTCLQFPPSRIAVTLRLEAVGAVQPVHFWFSPYWYRTADTGADIQANVTRDPSTFEATLAGGRYCYALTIDPVAPSTTSGDAEGQAQLVTLRMTLAPQ